MAAACHAPPAALPAIPAAGFPAPAPCHLPPAGNHLLPAPCQPAPATQLLLPATRHPPPAVRHASPAAHLSTPAGCPPVPAPCHAIPATSFSNPEALSGRRAGNNFIFTSRLPTFTRQPARFTRRLPTPATRHAIPSHQPPVFTGHRSLVHRHFPALTFKLLTPPLDYPPRKSNLCKLFGKIRKVFFPQPGS